MGRILSRLGWWALLLAATSFLVLWDLDKRPLQDFHEGAHATIALDLVDGGEPAGPAALQSRLDAATLTDVVDDRWLTPQWGGQPWFGGPPLNEWGVAALLGTLPPSCSDMWAVRLPNAVMGILAAVLLGWWVRRATGRGGHGLAAGICFASMKPLFYNGIRTGDHTGWLAFGLIGALAAWHVMTEPRTNAPGDNGSGADRPRRFWAFAMGLCLGFGLMGKGIEALLVIPIAVLHGLTTTVRWPRLPELLVLLITTLLVAAPWHVWMAAEHGAAFWEAYLGLDEAQRLVGTVEGERFDAASAFGRMAVLWIPLGALLPAGILWLLRDAARPHRADSAASVVAGAEGLDNPEPQIPLVCLRNQSFAVLLLVWMFVGMTVATVANDKMYYLLLGTLAPAMVAATGMLARACPGRGEWLAGTGWLITIWCLGAQLPSSNKSLTDWVDSQLGGPLWAWQPMLTGAAAVLVVALGWRLGLLFVDRATAGRIAHRKALILLLLAQGGVWYLQVSREHGGSELLPMVKALDTISGDSQGATDKSSPIVYADPELAQRQPAGMWHLRRSGTKVQPVAAAARGDLPTGSLLLLKGPVAKGDSSGEASPGKSPGEGWERVAHHGSYILWRRR